jgi:Uma2 family endonuclease
MGQLAERQRPLRREEYERMIDAGLFRDERIELLRGVLVQRSPQNLPHAGVIQVLTRVLAPALLGRADVRVQLPFNVGDDSVPEPDFAIVEPIRYTRSHPDRAFLIVEVADSSLKIDRGDKLELYAEAAVPEYWIANLAEATIERHSEPSHGAYGRLTTFRRGETVQILAFPDVAVRVDDIFGE